MIEFDCPQCQHHITAPDSAAGDAKICPKCNSSVTVPNVGTTATDATTVPTPAPTTADIATAGVASDGATEGTRIPCPICGELIPAQAKKCRFCGELLGAPPPSSAQRPVAGVGPVSDVGKSELKGAWDYIREFWTTKFCVFAGRAPRREFWFVQLHLIALEVGVFLFTLFTEGLGTVVSLIVGNAVLIPDAALASRRCHDANVSGKVGIAVSLLPLVAFDVFNAISEDESDDTNGALFIFAIVLSLAWIIGWIVIGVMQGVKGANQHGPNPYENPDNVEPRDPTAA